MIPKALVSALFSTITVFAGQHINVRICNLGSLPDGTVARAQGVVVAIFRPIQIEVDWTDCEGGGASRDPWPGRNIVLRLRRDGSIDEAAGESLDVMGMAFTSAGVAGYMADAYYGAIEKFARERLGDPAEALGYVVAHEIGHLLLGPGHEEGSIMSAKWNNKTLAAARQRWLTFSPTQRATIHHELQARTMVRMKGQTAEL